ARSPSAATSPTTSSATCARARFARSGRGRRRRGFARSSRASRSPSAPAAAGATCTASGSGRGLGQRERLRQKRRHLAPRDGVGGAVEQGARGAASGDLLGVELLDPIGEETRAVDVPENPGARGRCIGRAVLGLEQEGGHLLAGDGASRTVVPAAAA